MFTYNLLFQTIHYTSPCFTFLLSHFTPHMSSADWWARRGPPQVSSWSGNVSKGSYCSVMSRTYYPPLFLMGRKRPGPGDQKSSSTRRMLLACSFQELKIMSSLLETHHQETIHYGRSSLSTRMVPFYILCCHPSTKNSACLINIQNMWVIVPLDLKAENSVTHSR